MDAPDEIPAAPAGGSKPAAPGKRRLSPQALAARRANIAKAHAADKDLIYRPTERRRAASRANIQKAIAWRRSPEGNASARLNAFKHGLAAENAPGLLARLGEAPEDFSKHLERVQRVFRSADKAERELVLRLAQATWRRMRIFRAQARYERWFWRRMAAQPGSGRRLTPEEFEERADKVLGFLREGHLAEYEAGQIDRRIKRILKALLHEHARNALF